MAALTLRSTRPTSCTPRATTRWGAEAWLAHPCIWLEGGGGGRVHPYLWLHSCTQSCIMHTHTRTACRHPHRMQTPAPHATAAGSWHLVLRGEGPRDHLQPAEQGQAGPAQARHPATRRAGVCPLCLSTCVACVDTGQWLGNTCAHSMPSQGEPGAGAHKGDDFWDKSVDVSANPPAKPGFPGGAPLPGSEAVPAPVPVPVPVSVCVRGGRGGAACSNLWGAGVWRADLK